MTYMSINVRTMRDTDLNLVRSWRNNPEVRRFMLTQHEISPEEHQSWFARVKQDESRCQLVAESGDLPVGYVQFSGVSLGGVADWGFYIAPQAPKGTGKAMGAAALDYGFSVLSLHKICGQALAYNAPSIGFHQHLGFTQEGVLRQHCLIDETYHDLICFGLLKAEWVERNNTA